MSASESDKGLVFFSIEGLNVQATSFALFSKCVFIKFLRIDEGEKTVNNKVGHEIILICEY